MDKQTTSFDLPDDVRKYVAPPEVTPYRLRDDGTFPNNETLPLLVYPGAVELPHDDPAGIFEALFSANGWPSAWRDGVYGYHHYHSTAHEVLGCYRGHAEVRLGGPDGATVTLRAGDVVVIPAGVAHKNLGSSGDFGVVGAYPAGQQWDMNYGEEGERPEVDRQIAQVPRPESDPIYGTGGPLLRHWQD
jgi:uncharacterized protein YjlB